MLILLLVEDNPLEVEVIHREFAKAHSERIGWHIDD